ncbi:MAG: glycosyltransferase [Pirellulales bacterium]
MESKADVHIHSKYSDRPSEWVLRRIGSPESFVEPLEVYHRCRERGMNFVTISDHNCINGALDIAHLAGTFLSTEVTTYFPEDGCKMHILVLGISEEQFRMIQELRSNIYDFQQYCVEQDIVYSVAHPLFRVNDRLTVEHVERLLLLFKRFEGINGTRDPRASQLVMSIFANLDETLIEEMANRHDIEPLGPEPWKKWFTAGSDDHGGLYMASAHTITPYAADVPEFLDHLRRGDHEMGGTSGTSLKLAHSFYQIAYSYYQDRFLRDPSQKSLIGELFKRMLEGSSANSPTVGAKVRHFIGKFRGSRADSFSEVEASLIREFAELFQHSAVVAPASENRDSEVTAGGVGGSNGHLPDALNTHGGSPTPGANSCGRVADDRRIFQLACEISQQLSYAFARKFGRYFREGRLIESLQTLASLGPVALSIAPYLAAFATQHKDERLLKAVASHFTTTRHLSRRSDRRGWVTDTYSDVNGVTRTIRELGRVAAEQDLPLTILTSLSGQPDCPCELHNFTPVGEFELPEYEQQRVSLPPFLEVLEYIERRRFSELIISTPGPLGLNALMAARLCGLQTTGIYHTDFPLFVRHITQDAHCERLTWRYMQWFYGQMDRVLVPSEYYRRDLIEHGFDARKLQVMRRGVDGKLFHPDRRDEGFWSQHRIPDGFKFIYVGRISEEKNLDLLLDAFGEMAPSAPDAHLILVGDGPLLEELRRAYASDRIHFTGVLDTAEVATAMATADIFVFPSTTDTFGCAVLEAQACGLPAIVSNQGGPSEIVSQYESGLIVDVHAAGALRMAMQTCYDNQGLRERLRKQSLKNAEVSTWEGVLDEFWNSTTPPQEETENVWQIQRTYQPRHSVPVEETDKYREPAHA